VRRAGRARPRIGLIGCGAIASNVHLPLLAGMREAELVMVADPDPRARDRATAIGGVPAVADARSVLERADIDAVVICTANAQHASMAIAAAQAGKHIYLEKPIATTAEDAAAAVAAVERAGVIAAVGFNRRFHPAMRQARALIAAGAIGRVMEVQTAFCEPAGELPEWKAARASGGGVLLDLGSHHMDLVRWIVGRETVAVQATLASARSEHDSARVRLDLGEGVEAQCVFSFRASRVDVIQVVGETGLLRADRLLPPLKLWTTPGARPGLRRGRAPVDAAALAWRLRRRLRPGDPSYAPALRAWVAALAGRERALPGVRDGAASLAIVLAAERSAAQGIAVGL
jgi:predicted dehydrogenase